MKVKNLLILIILLICHQHADAITYQNVTFIDGPEPTVAFEIADTDTAVLADGIIPEVNLRLDLAELYNSPLAASSVKIISKKLNPNGTFKLVSSIQYPVTNVQSSLVFTNKLIDFKNPSETYHFYIYDTKNYLKAHFAQTFTASDILSAAPAETVDSSLSEEEIIAAREAETFFQNFFSATLDDSISDPIITKNAAGLHTLHIPSATPDISALENSVTSNIANIASNAAQITSNASNVNSKANSTGPVFEGNFLANNNNENADFRVEGENDSNLFFIDGSADNIGIGTNTPDANAKLEVNGQVRIAGGNPALNRILVSDANGIATWQDPPASSSAVFSASNNIVHNSAGDLSNDDFVFGSAQLDDDTDSNHDSRFFFDKSKAAFRAGLVTGTSWDDVNRANYSLAVNKDSLANAETAIAIGEESQASATDAIAIGYQAISQAANGIALGNNTNASNTNTISIGTESNSSGLSSLSIGSHLTASNNSSFVFGKGIDTANRLINNDADSLKIGFNSDIATLYISTSSGVGTSGNIGIGNSSPSEKLSITGNLAVSGTVDGVDVANMNTQSTNNTTTLNAKANISGATFTGDISASSVGVGTSTPDEALHVQGNIKIVDGNQGAGKVLTSNSNGVGSWQASPWLSYAVYTHSTTGLTAGGNCPATNTWFARSFNNTQGEIGSKISRSGNTITLEPGTYYIEAHAPAYRADTFSIRLRNISDGVTELEGSSEYNEYSAHYVQTQTVMHGVINVVTTKNFELQMQVSNNSAGADCLGSYLLFSGPSDENIMNQIFIRELPN